MRHSPDLHSFFDRSQSPSRPDLPADGYAAGCADPGAPGTMRLSQSATTAELLRIKRIMHARDKRTKHFDSQIFADPAWDILLYLARAEMEHRRISVSELCLAAAVPATTALRWINSMMADRALTRRPDAFDRRRAYIELSRETSLAMKSYLSEVQV